MVNVFFGLENELISYTKDGRLFDFNTVFQDFAKGGFGAIMGSYRADGFFDRTGNSFYMDGSVPEITTPPVPLTQGFATRLARALAAGRNRLLEYSDELVFTGYSSHWNLTNTGWLPYDVVKHAAAVPFHLFGSTPLSVGFGIRHADRGLHSSHELLTDSIRSYQQLRASSLLFGVTLSQLQNGALPPVSLNEEYESANDGGLLHDGRDTKLSATIGKRERIITAQEYLERFYHWLQPAIEPLSTLDERKLLDDYVRGRRTLEFDRARFYEHVEEQAKYDNGKYAPFTYGGWSTTVQRGPHAPAAEGKLFGALVRELGDKMRYLYWDTLILNDSRCDSRQLPGEDYTSNTYALASRLLGAHSVVPVSRQLVRSARSL